MALSWDLVDVDTSELGVGPLILTDVLTVVSDLIFRLSDICQGNEGCDKADCKTSSQSAGEDCLTRSLPELTLSRLWPSLTLVVLNKMIHHRDESSAGYLHPREAKVRRSRKSSQMGVSLGQC